MARFTLSTDSTCDLYHDYLLSHDIKMVPLTFTVIRGDKVETRLDAFTEYKQYVDFYRELQEGAVSKTAMLNYEAHYAHFLALAKAGAKDVLHFCISSGLARTHEVAKEAAADVKKLYPEFRVFVADPLSATIGQGLLVELALECRDEDMTAQEAYRVVTESRLRLQHFYVADDLQYLKRGGRISAAVAAIGGVLNIKPILSIDKEGKLNSIAKARGIKKAISFIKERMEKLTPDEHKKVIIVHTGNEEAAREIYDFVVQRFMFEPQMQMMGPVIGSHVGPNAFGIAYLSSFERNEF